jgi:transposase-like protein
MSRFVALEELFKGRHFDQEIVVLCVRWYLSKLSYRDLVSMMNERGICLAHTTILRWVQHYTPGSSSSGNAMRARSVAPRAKQLREA